MLTTIQGRKWNEEGLAMVHNNEKWEAEDSIIAPYWLSCKYVVRPTEGVLFFLLNCAWETNDTQTTHAPWLACCMFKG